MSEKVLAYAGFENAKKLWPEAEICEDNPPLQGAYDVIYLENLMQQFLRKQVKPALDMFRNALKPGGKIYVVVPALEWACKQIAVGDEPNKLAYPSLYGTDEEPHFSGYTLVWLRAMFEGQGFRTLEAYSQEYNVELNGDPMKGRSNVYIGELKIENPGEAFG